MTQTECPECSGRLVSERGERLCTDCGLVVDEYRIDHGPERRSFGPDADASERTGPPLTPARHDRGLATEIGYGVDAHGTPVSAAKRHQLSRLRREHGRARWRSKGERNLAHAFGAIARVTSALDLPKRVREEAATIYRRAQRENLILGRTIEGMAAASVYAACRCGGFSRSVEEVTAVAGCRPQAVMGGYRVLNTELGLAAVPTGPASRVPRLAIECGVSDQVQCRALELASIAEATDIANGRKPSGVAAACLYVAGKEADEPVTQTTLGDAAGVSAHTIRERYRELLAVVAIDEGSTTG